MMSGFQMKPISNLAVHSTPQTDCFGEVITLMKSLDALCGQKSAQHGLPSPSMILSDYFSLKMIKVMQ